MKAPASTHGLQRRLLQARGGWWEEKTCGLMEERTERISGRGSHPLFGLPCLTSDDPLEQLPCLCLVLGWSSCLKGQKIFFQTMDLNLF